MSIAFFDNGSLGLLFGKVSNVLNEIGLETYLLTLSKRKKIFLEKKGIKNIIYLDVNEGNKTIGENIIRSVEREFPEFRLYRAIELDRILKYGDETKTKNFLFKFTDSFYRFLESKKIDFIFGEITWAIEYIAYFLMKFKGKYYFNPLNNYIIPGRFAFMDYKNSSSFLKKEFSKQDLEKAEEFYSNRIKSDINKNAKFLQTYIPANFKERLHNLLLSYSKEDYRYSLTLKVEILKKYLNRFILSKYFKSFKDLSFIEKNKDKYKFAVFNLHIQPEATPDVVATYYNDQFRLIEIIRASLPENFILLVKEHPNGIGSRSIGWLKKVSDIHGVELINPKIPMVDLFNYIDIVFSIAGTVAFESSLYKIPAIIFSDVFLEIFPMVKKEKNFDALPYTILSLLNNNMDNKYIKEKNIEAIAKIYANTFEGSIYDPLLNPNVLNPKNIKNISEAIKIIVNRK